MRFDWTVNVGEILTGLGLLLGLAAAHIQNVRRLDRIEARIDLVYEWFRDSVINKLRG